MAGSAAKAAHDAEHRRMGTSARLKIFIVFSVQWAGRPGVQPHHTNSWREGLEWGMLLPNGVHVSPNLDAMNPAGDQRTARWLR